MPNLATVLGISAAGAGKVEESLPTFGVWSCYANNQNAFGVFDSYGNTVTSGYPNTDAEQWSNFGGRKYTNNSIGSNSMTTSFWQATCMNQAEGHWGYNFPSTGGGYSNIIRPDWYPANFWPFFGVTIGASGKRQKYSLYSQGTNIQVHRRGGYNLGSFTVNSATYLNVTGEPGTTNQGTISYNSKTQTLVWIRANASASYRMHIWKNPNINLEDDGLSTGRFLKFLSDAKAGVGGASYFYNDFTWNTSGSTSYDESRYHFRVIMGDNGYVGLVRMTPSNQTVHAYVVPNALGTAPTSGPTTVSVLGLTTSYGIEQGTSYGMRSNITWDNAWVACYSPYYYYGCGINAHFVSTADPSKGYVWQDGNTTWGWAIFPIGKSEFAMHLAGWNVDGGAGVLLYIASPGGTVATGKGQGGGTIGNSGTLEVQSSYLAIDTGYTSTDYPHLGAMNSWSKVG